MIDELLFHIDERKVMVLHGLIQTEHRQTKFASQPLDKLTESYMQPGCLLLNLHQPQQNVVCTVATTASNLESFFLGLWPWFDTWNVVCHDGLCSVLALGFHDLQRVEREKRGLRPWAGHCDKNWHSALSWLLLSPHHFQSYNRWFNDWSFIINPSKPRMIYSFMAGQTPYDLLFYGRHHLHPHHTHVLPKEPFVFACGASGHGEMQWYNALSKAHMWHPISIKLHFNDTQ